MVNGEMNGARTVKRLRTTGLNTMVTQIKDKSINIKRGLVVKIFLKNVWHSDIGNLKSPP